MSTHTPGPWIIEKHGTIKTPTGTLSVSGVLIPCGRIPEDDVCHANARLIAAAPELLAALIDLRDWYWENVGLPAVAANAAIAKATGKEGA